MPLNKEVFMVINTCSNYQWYTISLYLTRKWLIGYIVSCRIGQSSESPMHQLVFPQRNINMTEPLGKINHKHTVVAFSLSTFSHKVKSVPSQYGYKSNWCFLSGFLCIKRVRIVLFPLDRMPVHPSLLSFCTPGWRGEKQL